MRLSGEPSRTVMQHFTGTYVAGQMTFTGPTANLYLPSLEAVSPAELAALREQVAALRAVVAELLPMLAALRR